MGRRGGVVPGRVRPGGDRMHLSPRAKWSVLTAAVRTKTLLFLSIGECCLSLGRLSAAEDQEPRPASRRSATSAGPDAGALVRSR
jgi:hypothetical protein